jgi:hypothetical protein
LRCFRAQFHIELLNAFNHPVFNNPNTDPMSANFGKVSTAPASARDQDHQILGAGLLQPVWAAGPGQHCRAGRHVEALAVNRHDAAAAEHVIDLVFLLQVVADAMADPGFNARLRKTSFSPVAFLKNE